MTRCIKPEFVKKLKENRIEKIALKEGVLINPLNYPSGTIRIYCYGKNPDSRIEYVGIKNANELKNIEKAIYEKYSDIRLEKEKYFQYWLAWKLNNEQDTDYRCLCTEYSVPKHTQNKDFGRQDLLIIDKKGNLLIIECKYTAKSLGGSSGVEAHAKDFRKILGEDDVWILEDSDSVSELRSDISQDLKALFNAQKALNINNAFDGYSNVKKVKCAFLYIDVSKRAKKRNTEGCPIYELEYNGDKDKLYCDFKKNLAEAFSQF